MYFVNDFFQKVMTRIDVRCCRSVWSSLSFDVLLLFVWEERDWSNKCWGPQQQPKQQLNNKDICKGPLKEKFVNLISQLKQKLSASIIHKDKGRNQFWGNCIQFLSFLGARKLVNDYGWCLMLTWCGDDENIFLHCIM